jgi:20S proteasome alpha/beta subunit
MRTRSALRVSVLIAGWNKVDDRPVLYWLDSIGALQEVPYAVQGGEFQLLLGLLDRKDKESGDYDVIIKKKRHEGYGRLK